MTGPHPVLGPPALRAEAEAIGEAVGGIDYASVSVAFRGFQQRLQQDPELAIIFQKAQDRFKNVKV